MSLFIFLGLQAIFSCVDGEWTDSVKWLIVPQKTGDLISILKLAMDLPYCTNLAE